MDEKTESLIERGASLLIGLVLVLIGLMVKFPIDSPARSVLLGIGIPLISLATGIQLLNSVPHAIVDARNYVKNAGQQETLIPKEQVDNTTELPEWLKEVEELGKQMVKVREQPPDIEPEPVPEPPLETVVFPEEECEEEPRFPGQEPVVEENAKGTF